MTYTMVPIISFGVPEFHVEGQHAWLDRVRKTHEPLRVGPAVSICSATGAQSPHDNQTENNQCLQK